MVSDLEVSAPSESSGMQLTGKEDIQPSSGRSPWYLLEFGETESWDSAHVCGFKTLLFY